MSKPRILIVDDEKAIRFALREFLAGKGYDAISSDGECALLEFILDKDPQAVLLDIKLPKIDGMDLLKSLKDYDPEMIVIMMTAFGDIDSAVQAMKLGAYDYVEKPFNNDKVGLIIKNALEKRSLKKEVGHIRLEQRKKYGLSSIIGRSAAMVELRELVEKVAQSQASTVFIRGMSGTGKSLVARIIHYISSRSENPFVEVNCTALPESLLESELFGHEKGAFTDAKRNKKGLFELADGGTLFLDEIGDMTPAMQSKLLRAIEEKSFRRVGGLEDITVDIRIITATNKDLEASVRSGSFREDLYYRLKVMPIYIVSLKDRKEDISELVKHFVRELNREFKKDITGLEADAQNVLFAYSWPGNVREVRNVIERAMILCDDHKICAKNLLLMQPGTERREESEPEGQTDEAARMDMTLENMEKRHIVNILRDTNWNRNKTARILRINRTTLYNKIEKYKLDDVNIYKKM